MRPVAFDNDVDMRSWDGTAHEGVAEVDKIDRSIGSRGVSRECPAQGYYARGQAD